MFIYRMKVAQAAARVRKITDRRIEARDEGDTMEEEAQAGLHVWALTELLLAVAEAVCVTMAQVETMKREKEKGG